MSTPLPSARSDSQDREQTLPHTPAQPAEQATLPPGAAQSSNDGSAVVSNGVRFRRLREHAKGGLGEVFVALDEELNREVALKEIQERFADLDDARTRFLREAEITGKLEHPGVVPVYGMGAYADGRPFYAMRFIHGQSMEEAIARFHKADEDPRRDPGERSLALRELLGRFVAVCNAVAYAHSKGIIHRDLKPANAMLGEYGETLVVDWGLAKQLRIADCGLRIEGQAEGAIAGSSSSNPQSAIRNPQSPTSESGNATEMGQVIGTPAYMPPEQASGRQDQVGTSSDVFALGATLYCLLTGQPPYSGIDALIQAAMAEVVPARQRKRSVPAALEAVCRKAMAAKLEERYGSARELAEEVQRFLADEPVQAYREPLADRGRRWGRRNRSVVSAAVVLLVAGVVGLSVGLWAVGREQELTKAALERALSAEKEAKANLVKAEKAEAATLADYRDSTDDAIEQLIGSKPVLGAQEKTYLEKTLKRWQVFAARTGDDERARAIRAEGQFRVALLRQKLGQSEDVVAGYREALALYQKLSDEFPAIAGYRKDLAHTHNNLGVLFKDQNQEVEAAKQYHNALAIQLELADKFPAEPAYRKDLASTHNNLGRLLAAQNEGAKAAEQFHKALSIRQKLADEFPAVNEYRTDLASSHNNLGILLADQNEEAKAAEQFHKALGIQQRLVDEFRAVPLYRQYLADTHNNLGNMLVGRNQETNAAKQYHKALAIRQKLADEFPAVPVYRQDLAHIHRNLGNLLRNQNERAKAAEQYHKAQAVQQRLADEFPAVPAYRKDLADTHNEVGILLAGQDQGANASEQYHKALAIRQKLADEFPTVPEYRIDLAASHLSLGALLAAQNQGAKAVKQYHKAREIQQKLADEFPAVPSYRVYLAVTYHHLGRLLAAQNDGPKAAEQYHKAREIQQKLADEFPAVPSYRKELALTHNNLGILLADHNQGAKAAEQFHKALSIRQKLADEFPAVTVYQIDLGGNCCNYGNLLSDSGKPADSLLWYDKAIRTLTRVYQQDPRVVESRLFLCNSHWGRAEAYDQLEKYAEAVKDWNQAIELSPRQEQPRFRVRRANSRVRAGQVAEAVTEIVELTKASTLPAAAWYDFACIYAVASSKSADKKQPFADRAMELLHKAVKAGYKDAAHMAKDKDLDPLRGRDDFMKLLVSLTKAKE